MALTEGWNGSSAHQASEVPVGLDYGLACGLGFVLLSLWAELPTIPVPRVVTIDLCWLQNYRLRQQNECKRSRILMPGLGYFRLEELCFLSADLAGSQLSIWWQLEDSLVRFQRFLGSFHHWVSLCHGQVVIIELCFDALPGSPLPSVWALFCLPGLFFHFATGKTVYFLHCLYNFSPKIHPWREGKSQCPLTSSMPQPLISLSFSRCSPLNLYALHILPIWAFPDGLGHSPACEITTGAVQITCSENLL